MESFPTPDAMGTGSHRPLDRSQNASDIVGHTVTNASDVSRPRVDRSGRVENPGWGQLRRFVRSQ